MVVLNDKDVRQKTGVILEQKSNLMERRREWIKNGHSTLKILQK